MWWRDFDEMMAEMESRFTSLLSGLPAVRGEFRVDVRDHEDEIIVVADLPGCEKEDVHLRLISPDLLQISCERRLEKEEEEVGYYIRERSFGAMRRTIALPADVTEEGASATFKNGVLEAHLKKVAVTSQIFCNLPEPCLLA